MTLQHRAVLRVSAHLQAPLMGMHGMTISLISEQSGAKLWLQPSASSSSSTSHGGGAAMSDAFTLQASGTAQQVKLAKQRVLDLCVSQRVMERSAMLPQVFRDWVLHPSLVSTSHQKSSSSAAMVLPAAFAGQMRRIQSVLEQQAARPWLSVQPSPASPDRLIEVHFTSAVEEDDAIISHAKHFVFNELFFITHADMRALSMEHFDLLTRHSTGMRRDHTKRFADGNTPFLTPRSQTVRMSSELVALNTYGLSDFFAQLEHKTGVLLAMAGGSIDVLPGQRDVCMYGEADVIRAAYIPLVDQVEEFEQRYDKWRGEMRRGYLAHLGVAQRDIDAYLAEPLETPATTETQEVVAAGGIEVLLGDEDIDRVFPSDDEASGSPPVYQRLPARERVRLTWERVAHVGDMGGAAPDWLSVDSASLDDEAKEMLQFAMKMEQPKLADQLLAAVEAAKDLAWVRNRGAWRRRYDSLVYRLRRQVGRKVLSGRVYTDTMEYLKDFTELVRSQGLVFPKQVLVDYVDEDELEDIESGEMYTADIEGDDDDEEKETQASKMEPTHSVRTADRMKV